MKNLNPCFLLLISQPKVHIENTPPPDWSIPPPLNQINRDMFVSLLLSKNQAPEVMKTNARYLGRVEDILAYEAVQDKNTYLMTAWDDWAKSLEEILTGKQYDLFLSWNHDSLWATQVCQV